MESVLDQFRAKLQALYDQAIKDNSAITDPKAKEDLKNAEALFQKMLKHLDKQIEQNTQGKKNV